MNPPFFGEKHEQVTEKKNAVNLPPTPPRHKKKTFSRKRHLLVGGRRGEEDAPYNTGRLRPKGYLFQADGI